MKKFTLIIVVVMGLMMQGTTAQTNVYHTFPDSAFWRVDSQAAAQQEEINDYWYYYFDGDTIINATSYKKLMKSGIWEDYIDLNNNNHHWYWFYDSIPYYYGALRDDSIVNKAFMILPSQNTDTLLFDYNVVVGDTLNGLLINTGSIIVSSIDSIFVGMNYRKRWNFNGYFFIQGIGTNMGLLEKLIPPSLSITGLICVKDRNTLFYEDTSWSTYSAIGCQLVTSTNNISPSITRFNIYPNPATKTITLHSTMSIINCQLSIEDVLGNKIYQQFITNNSSLITEIDISTWSKGVYFYELRGANDSVRGKFIKE